MWNNLSSFNVMKKAQVFMVVVSFKMFKDRKDSDPSVTSHVKCTWHNPVAYYGLQSFSADTS